MPGTYNQIGGDTTLTITCNDPDGYGLYAVGASGTKDEEGNNNLVGTSSNIATGTATSGNTSAWSMKLSSPSSGLTIASGFDANHAIPATRTNVASRTAGTTPVAGDSVKVSYSAYVSNTQAPGTYTGKVNYILFHTNAGPLGTMQDFSCADLQDGQIATLIDSRDNNPYTVAKLKDGKCWMVDNLRLGLADKTMTLTSSDSDVASDFTLPASSTSGFVNKKYDVANVYVDGTYGGYYTWFAATAGEGKSSMSSGNVSHSICPKGWRLPTGGSGGEFKGLYSKYNSSALMLDTPVPAFVLSGKYESSSPYNQGSDGRYWSSTALSSDNAHTLYLNSSLVDPTSSNTKGDGFPVRCVARR